VCLVIEEVSVNYTQVLNLNPIINYSIQTDEGDSLYYNSYFMMYYYSIGSITNNNLFYYEWYFSDTYTIVSELIFAETLNLLHY